MARLFELSASEMAGLLSKGQISAAELVEVHLARIAECQPRLNAFTSIFEDQARRQAKALDGERKQGRVRGPLHGLPISIKECFDIEGLPTTLGVKARLNSRAPRDAALVTALKEAGAVILGRTNVSQFMLFHESRNPVYGQTSNPFDTTRTPGGSSGGEAAALASGMSPLGVGTDIGGSIRIPAHFSGVCGLKPTLDRWPMHGVVGGLPGQEVIRSAAGPMARSTRDLRLMWLALKPARLSELDARVPPWPTSDPDRVSVRDLRVGYLKDDDIVPVSLPVRRAMAVAIDGLRDAGLDVVPFVPPRERSPLLDYIALLSADGGETVQRLARTGPLDSVIEASLQTVRLGPWRRRAVGWWCQWRGEGDVAKLIRASGPKSVGEMWQLTKGIRDYREDFLNAIAEAGVDVLLCPPHATCALPHGAAKNFAPAGALSMLFNLLQFPAGVVPITTVRPDEAFRHPARQRLHRQAAEVAIGSTGLPVGVQVIGTPWHDEQVLAVMQWLEDAARQKVGFPHTPVP
jgi:fatty acid amide hydrolase